MSQCASCPSCYCDYSTIKKGTSNNLELYFRIYYTLINLVTLFYTIYNINQLKKLQKLLVFHKIDRLFCVNAIIASTLFGK